MARHFQALKMHADKKMKFQQGKLLGALATGDLGEDVKESPMVMQSDAVVNGVCAALSTNWLKDCSSFGNQGEHAIVLGVNGQYLYKRVFKGHIHALLESVGLEASEQLPLPETPPSKTI